MKIQRISTWIVLNLGAVACMWFGGFQNQQWALNLLVFFTVVTCLGYTAVVFSVPARKECHNKGRSVPAWLSSISDWAVIIGLVASGHLWIAAGWFWAAACESFIYSDHGMSTKEEVKP